jgi:hypothetical protein
VNFEELTHTLQKLDATIPASTIRRWAKDKLVTPPSRRHRQKGEGRGTISDWSQHSLEEIAGCYCIKNFGSYRRDFADSVRRAKYIASLFYADPVGFASSIWPNVYTGYYVPYEVSESQKDFGHALYVADRRDFFEYVGGMEKAKLSHAINDRVYCDFLFVIDGDIESSSLRYEFAGVGFTPIEEPIQTEVRVRTYSREDFFKLKERAEIKIRGSKPKRKDGAQT